MRGRPKGCDTTVVGLKRKTKPETIKSRKKIKLEINHGCISQQHIGSGLFVAPIIQDVTKCH